MLPESLQWSFGDFPCRSVGSVLFMSCMSRAEFPARSSSCEGCSDESRGRLPRRRVRSIPSLFSRARSEYGGAADTTTWLRWCRSDFVAALSVCHEEVFASPIKSPSIKNCLRRRRIWIGGTLSGGKVCTCCCPRPSAQLSPRVSIGARNVSACDRA